MSESKLRQFHTPELKAKVGLEALLMVDSLTSILQLSRIICVLPS